MRSKDVFKIFFLIYYNKFISFITFLGIIPLAPVYHNNTMLEEKT